MTVPVPGLLIFSFPSAIIRHAIWLHLRFILSYREVEELLAERGLRFPIKRCGGGF